MGVCGRVGGGVYERGCVAAAAVTVVGAVVVAVRCDSLYPRLSFPAAIAIEQ